jgi:hypothetical protein
MSIQIKTASWHRALFLEQSRRRSTTAIRWPPCSQDAWIKVRAIPECEGWLHGSALTSKIKSSSSPEAPCRPGRRQRRLALVGKGFSKQLRENLKAETAARLCLDQPMEQVIVSQTQIELFLKDGLLVSPGGIHEVYACFCPLKLFKRSAELLYFTFSCDPAANVAKDGKIALIGTPSVWPPVRSIRPRRNRFKKRKAGPAVFRILHRSRNINIDELSARHRQQYKPYQNSAATAISLSWGRFWQWRRIFRKPTAATNF